MNYLVDRKHLNCLCRIIMKKNYLHYEESCGYICRTKEEWKQCECYKSGTEIPKWRCRLFQCHASAIFKYQTDENIAQKHKIISIPESSREEMYELTKREFLQNNGIQNGDTTKRGDVYNNLYKKMSMKLAAGNTLQQYETAYRQAFIATVKEQIRNGI